jgi:opacity protein-like surface antigen
LAKLGTWAVGALAAAALLPPAARGQLVETSISPAGDYNWSATAGRTVGNANSVLQAEVGWPGIGFTYLKGLDEKTDIGFHVGFNYGFEGTTNTVTGLNLAVPYRRVLGQSGDTTITFRTDPGVSIYSNNGSALFGVGGPIGLVAGFRLDPRFTLSVGADVPVLVSFSNPAGFLFGPQVGGGGEYLIDKNLAITARVRVGPQFSLHSAGSGSQTGFQTLIGLAYNAR